MFLSRLLSFIFLALGLSAFAHGNPVVPNDLIVRDLNTLEGSSTDLVLRDDVASAVLEILLNLDSQIDVILTLNVTIDFGKIEDQLIAAIKQAITLLKALESNVKVGLKGLAQIAEKYAEIVLKLAKFVIKNGLKKFSDLAHELDDLLAELVKELGSTINGLAKEIHLTLLTNAKIALTAGFSILSNFLKLIF